MCFDHVSERWPSYLIVFLLLLFICLFALDCVISPTVGKKETKQKQRKQKTKLNTLKTNKQTNNNNNKLRPNKQTDKQTKTTTTKEEKNAHDMRRLCFSNLGEHQRHFQGVIT